MKYYGKAQEAADKLVAAFESGQVPKALAAVFITGAADRHCSQWSWNNRLLVALNGYTDAMGFNQWKAIDRHVKKGEKAFPILAPRMITQTNQDTGEKEQAVIGFVSVPVFGFEQTDGKPIEVDSALTAWLDNLPLREVAESWGLNVNAYNGANGSALGYYSPDKSISLGVQNLSTWTHELMHAADHKVKGKLKNGQDVDQEIVAELGGAVLLEVIGKSIDSDRGGCWEYISKYAEKAKIQPITAINRVLTRTCQAISLILETAEALQSPDLAA